MKPIDDLEQRVRLFETLQLPGQPRMMHMGTGYLVGDLWEAVRELRDERDEYRQFWQNLSNESRSSAQLIDELKADIADRCARSREREREIAELRAKVERLTAWLLRIEGGDNPCEDAAQLRQWAYEAVTLGREVSDG